MNQDAPPEPPPFSLARLRLTDAVATPAVLDPAAGTLTGCLHDADGRVLPLSQRFGGHLGDHFRTADPTRIDPPDGAERLDGRTLYLGHMMHRHYGHFITETLSTFWSLLDEPADAFDHVLFHPFPAAAPSRLPAHVVTCLAAFGIRPERVVFADRPLRLAEATVPERLLRLNHSADTRLRPVYARIAAAAPPAAEGAPRRLWLSRRGLARRAGPRTVANESRVEALFARAGFVAVRPEALSFEAQLALWRGAEAIAGFSGSALHNSLFLTEGALALELGDRRFAGTAPTQALCDRIAGARSAAIPFRGRAVGGARPILLADLPALRDELAVVLEAAELGAPDLSLPPWKAGQAAEAAGIAARGLWRGARAALGARLRAARG